MYFTKRPLPGQKIVYDTENKKIVDCFFAHGEITKVKPDPDDNFPCVWFWVKTIRTKSRHKWAKTTFEHCIAPEHYESHKKILESGVLTAGAKIYMYWTKGIPSNSSWHIRGIDIFESPDIVGSIFPKYNGALTLLTLQQYETLLRQQ